MSVTLLTAVLKPGADTETSYSAGMRFTSYRRQCYWWLFP